MRKLWYWSGKTAFKTCALFPPLLSWSRSTEKDLFTFGMAMSILQYYTLRFQQKAQVFYIYPVIVFYDRMCVWLIGRKVHFLFIFSLLLKQELNKSSLVENLKVPNQVLRRFERATNHFRSLELLQHHLLR